jgi:hypothetical protein
MVVTRSAQARDDPGVVSKFQGVGMLDLASGRLTPVVTDEAPSIGPGGFIQLLHRAAVGANRIAFGLTTKELLGIVSGSDPAGVAWRPYSAEQQRAISRLAFSPNDRYLVAACSPPELSAGHRETFWRDRLLSVWSLTSDGSSPRSTR